MALMTGSAAAAVRPAWGFKMVLDISRHWSTEEMGGPDYTVESSNRMGYALGGFLQFELSPRFTLQPEVNFIRKGSVQSVSVADLPIGPIRVTYILDYIEVPLILKTYLRTDKKPLAPHLGIGPYAAILVHDRYRVKNSFLGESEQKIEDLRSTDFGVVFAAGLDVHGPDALFSFSYRYSMGFLDLVLPTGPGLPGIELRNQCHMFTLEVIL
jgi:hypothetical protein